MQTVFATLLIFGAVMIAMAFGVIFSNRPLKGSCGGTDSDCECSPARQRRCAAEAATSSGGSGSH